MLALYHLLRTPDQAAPSAPVDDLVRDAWGEPTAPVVDWQ